MTWTNLHPGTNLWTPLTSETTTVDDGVDFRLTFADAYPWILAEDGRGQRFFASTYSEGRP